MGHSEDDAVHKIPHKMKMHWQNRLKILGTGLILYRIRYKMIDVIFVQCLFKLFHKFKKKKLKKKNKNK